MSIADVPDKIKGFDESQKERIFVVVLILLVGIGAFGLGRLSLLEKRADPVRIEDSSSQPSPMPIGQGGEVKGASIVAADRVFASKTGTLYYTSGCTAGSRVSEKTKIWFDSGSDAEKFGLKPGCR